MVLRQELQGGQVSAILDSSIADLCRSSVQSYLFMVRTTFLKNCQSWDYSTGVICSFAFKPLFGHRELSVRSISSLPK